MLHGVISTRDIRDVTSVTIKSDIIVLKTFDLPRVIRRHRVSNMNGFDLAALSTLLIISGDADI